MADKRNANPEIPESPLGFRGVIKIVNVGETQMSRGKVGRVTFYRKNAAIVDGDRSLQFMEFGDTKFLPNSLEIGQIYNVELAGLDSRAKECSGRVISKFMGTV